jgi:hypothetical protein
MKPEAARTGFRDAGEFGFAPEATGLANATALQQAVDGGGTILISRPGTYRIAATVLVGSHTALVFGHGVFLQKVDEQGAFTHVLLNRGALTRTCDTGIAVEGLQLCTNGIDHGFDLVYGLRGQIAFFHVKDLHIRRFRCLDLGATQYAIHVCTFEDLIIDDVIISGDKDGVHLGRGRRFTIRNGVFRTYDDAVALNGHDYATSNPELGWIEDGVIENCHDLEDDKKPIGYFSRILAGAWIDWRPGMEVQNSDSVVSAGRVYRVQAKPDGVVYRSLTQPTHAAGNTVLEGINWSMVQADPVYSAGVRNVVFRDIFLRKPRVAFSVHFDQDHYSRSYYPGAVVPMQEQLSFDRIRVLHDLPVNLLSIDTPVDALTVAQSDLQRSRFHFINKSALREHPPTHITMTGCRFNHPGPLELVTNEIAGKTIHLKTIASTVTHEGFTASVSAGQGCVLVESDLQGLSR